MPGYKRYLSVLLLLLGTLFVGFLLANAQESAEERVDLNLVLAIDCSYSVDAREYDLQIHGTAAAFIDSQVINAITNGTHGKIAVTVVQWSNPQNQIVAIPWTVVASRSDAINLAIAIKSQIRQTAEGGTSISEMINKGATMLINAPTRADRLAIDIASDGENNSGERVEHVRDRTLGYGITINGLSILNEVSYLNYYFQNRVIGGLGAFVQIANSYNDFGEAIRRKLLREINGPGMS